MIYTSAVVSSTEVIAVEVRIGTAPVPPGTLILHSTVTTGPHIIVSVMSGELSTINAVTFYHAVTSCSPISSNVQFVVSTCIINRKIPVLCIFLVAFIVRKVYFQLCRSLSSRQSANLLYIGPANGLLLHFQSHSHSPSTLPGCSLTRRVVSGTRSILLHSSCHTRRRRAFHTLGLWCTLLTMCSPGHRPPGSQKGGGPDSRLEEVKFRIIRLQIMIHDACDILG